MTTPDIAFDPLDEDMLRRFLTGDAGAVSQVERWAWEVVACRPYGIPRDEWDDVVQDVLTAIWQLASREDFRIERGLRPLVRTIAAARCIDRVRRRRATVEVSEWIADERADPAADAVLRDETARLRTFLQRMDPRCQELIRLRFFEEVAYDTIAERLGKATSTLRVHVFNCMKRLRARMGATR